MMVNVNKKNNFAYVIVYQNIDPFGDISILTFYCVRQQTQSKSGSEEGGGGKGGGSGAGVGAGAAAAYFQMRFQL